MIDTGRGGQPQPMRRWRTSKLGVHFYGDVGPAPVVYLRLLDGVISVGPPDGGVVGGHQGPKRLIYQRKGEWLSNRHWCVYIYVCVCVC